jgi:hypothetical protein
MGPDGIVRTASASCVPASTNLTRTIVAANSNPTNPEFDVQLCLQLSGSAICADDWSLATNQSLELIFAGFGDHESKDSPQPDAV